MLPIVLDLDRKSSYEALNSFCMKSVAPSAARKAYLTNMENIPFMDELPSMPPDEIKRRIHGLQLQMAAAGVHGALITQRMDLLYFTGCAQNAYLYIPRSGEPILLVKKHLSRTSSDSLVPIQKSLESVRHIPKLILKQGHPMPRVLGTTWDALPVREFTFFRRLFRSQVQVDVADKVHALRSIKSPWEIERIASSSRLCKTTLEYLASRVFPGMTETHLEGISEAFARRLGHGGGIRIRHPSEDDRTGWLAGDLGVVPEKGPFTVGFRAVVNGYHASMARIMGRDSGSDADRLAAGLLEAFHRSVLSRAAHCSSLEELTRAAGMIAKKAKHAHPGTECKWTFQGTGLELREPIKRIQIPDTLKGGGMCIVLESSTQIPQGHALCIQDTMVVDAQGGRRL